ncbi:MAG TPA: GNAT family N-acetyltransferase [Pyrinomonadaceae bacterium]|jgi:hypothetical protein|nr:GNAT family N-acetyltransferase [Pyrinomonadaceae bacterium]
MQVTVHDTIDDLGPAAIEPLEGSPLDFSYGVLRALERSLWGDLSVRYLAVNDGGALAAFTPLFVGTNLNFNALLPRLVQSGYAALLDSMGVGAGYSVAVAGCPLSDRGWIPTHPEADPHAVVKILLPEIEAVARACGADFLMLKDIHEKFPETGQFLKAGFVQTYSLPGVSLATPYGSFDEYIEHRTKNGRKHFRKNSRKAVERGLSVSFHEDFAELVPAVYPLFRQTFLKAKYHFEELSPYFYRECAASRSPRTELLVCEKEGRRVGSVMLVWNSREFAIKRVGVDYAHEESGLVYNVMMYEGMRRAIERGVPQVSLGQSTYVPKTRLGGVMQNLHLYLKGFKLSLHASFPVQRLWLRRYRSDRVLQTLGEPAE